MKDRENDLTRAADRVLAFLEWHSEGRNRRPEEEPPLLARDLKALALAVKRLDRNAT